MLTCITAVLNSWTTWKEEVENAKQKLKVETDNSKHLNCNHLWDHPIRQTTPNPIPHSCALRDDILLKWLSHLLYLHILLLYSRLPLLVSLISERRLSKSFGQCNFLKQVMKRHRFQSVWNAACCKPDLNLKKPSTTTTLPPHFWITVTHPVPTLLGQFLKNGKQLWGFSFPR